MAAGVFLALLGTWILAQIFAGGALTRLKVL
jgi:hypothetical protein